MAHKNILVKLLDIGFWVCCNENVGVSNIRRERKWKRNIRLGRGNR